MTMDSEADFQAVHKLKSRKSIYQVTTYRLPYMTMPKKTLNRVFYSVFGFILVISLAQLQWFVNSVSIFGATCVPLSLYVIPGYYYSQFYKGYNTKKYWSGLVFAIFGMGIMVTYTALEFFSYAYMTTEES